MMMPASPDGVPLVPFASSISLSVTVVLVAVVVFPVTLRLPVTVNVDPSNVRFASAFKSCCSSVTVPTVRMRSLAELAILVTT